MAGGGIKGGIAYGKTDDKGEEIIENRGYQTNQTCIFASIPVNHDDYLFYKRGESIYSRMCLSEIISDHLHKQNFSL